MRATRLTTGAGIAILLVAAMTAAGCDTTREAGPMPQESASPPLSSTELPTLASPAKPPKTPSDLVPTDLAAGRVTRGGSGPCYGLITDDGTEYAVYSAAGRTLIEGTTVRIRFQPLAKKIDCGPGRPGLAIQLTALP